MPRPRPPRPASFADIPATPRARAKARSKGDLARPVKQRLLALWFRTFGQDCPDCGVEMIVPEPGHTSVPGSLASIDHIKARGLGGTNVASNLRVICTGCNNDKARGESQAVEARRKMYRERALKAARTRARNKAEAVRREALAAYHKARSRGASERAACAAAAARRAELEGKRR